MTVVKTNGHGTTSVLPAGADGRQVSPANVAFPQAPANQSGGTGTKGSAKVNPTGKGPNLNIKRA